jgi:hypothetical protein
VPRPDRTEPRAPVSRRRRRSLADRIELIHVPSSGPSVAGLDLSGLKWRQEVSAKGSPYRNMQPGQIIPGKRTPGQEGEPKLFTGRYRKARGFVSRAQWRKFFADPVLRRYAHEKAHKTKGGPKIRYRRLVERKGTPTPGSAR